MNTNIAVTAAELAVQNPLSALVFVLTCFVLVQATMIRKAWDMLLTKTLAPQQQHYRKRKRR
ncbi:hypothetical protein HMI49_13850 [Corallococcus exercitus]|uniref:Uncharacterized protein n=1 Tax=Corallococcus exercitus TaxID=2316736 RepID=A0A7Y4NS17_9BACT|nr:hypothetical protein [Corallococcus exercitus]NOK34281.1 hypothetical protein [Corallococcus exercitus]